MAQGVCNSYSYYYSDINYPGGVKQSDIYSVDLSDGQADLTPIALDLDYGAHIAYDEESGLLLLVNDANGHIQTLDPLTGTLGSTIAPESGISGVTTAAVDFDGNLIIGSSNGNIYTADLGSDPYGLTSYDTGADISGGDLTMTNNGLYLAAKPNGNLYTVLGGMANILMGTVDGNVTGMATMENQENVIVSSRNNGSFLEYTVDGGGVTETASYAAMLDGEAFTLDNGDMAAGCSERSSSVEGCDDLRTYYIHDALGGGPDILYSVVLNDGGGADLTELAELAGGSHLGVGADGLLYIVQHSSGMLTTYDPDLGPVSSVQIASDEGNITNIPAVVVDDNNVVYVGTSQGDEIYSVDPLTGDATFYGNGDVGGGDLVFIDDVLWVANRGQNTFHEVNGPGEFSVDATEINGVAVLPSGNLLVSDGNLGSLFKVYEPYTGDATGETFNTGLELYNGDLASRCFDGNDNVEGDCENFKIYLTDNTNGPCELYEVVLDDDAMTASLTLVRDGLPKSHVALGQDGTVYLIARTGAVAIYDPVTDALGAYLPLTIGEQNITNTHSAVVGEDGTLYVGSSSANMVYEVNPLTGEASNAVSNPVSGGDIIQTPDGNLWVVHRGQSRFYNITDGVTQFDVDYNGIYGSAVLGNGSIIVGTANTNSINIVDPEVEGGIGASFAMDLTMSAGDLAAACITDEPDMVPGECYATEVIEYAPGTQLNGNPIAPNRLDGNQALGEPERNDELNFASLGYSEDGMAFITLGFSGAVPNEDGDDIEIVETTFGVNGCESYPEYADVYVSQDGINFFFVENICRFDGFVDISDAGAFDYITQVKIVSADPSSSPDGFDVDGVVALHNCVDELGEGEEPVVQDDNTVEEAEDNAIQLTAFPNPSNGPVIIEFTSSTNDLALIEVLDMNGRVVETLFNSVTEAGNTYRFDFNGLALPNGVYVTKVTTNNTTKIEKLMIAH